MFFKETTLESGLKVITEEIPYVRSVSLGFWVAVGARDESDKFNGMSHFLEHLIFKGTKARTAKEISETFDALGGELNAYTAKEYTYFYTRLLDEQVPVGAEVLSDMIQNSLFGEKEILAEKEVVIEEINLHQDTPDELVHDLFAESLWKNHPLGRSGLGDAKTVRSFSRSDVVDFFSRNYVFDNMVIAAAGNLKHEQIVDLVQKSFTRKTARKADREREKPKASSGLALIHKNTEQAHIALGTEGLHAKHKDRFVLAILDNVFGGGMSSRLFQEVREKRGLVYSIYSYLALYAETGLFSVYAGTRPAQAERVVRIVKGEIDKLKEKGVTEEELHRSKEHLKGQMVLGMENTGTRMIRLGKSEIIQGEILSLDELVERIDRVSSADVLRVAQKVFGSNGLFLAAIGPLDEDKLSKAMS
jgi:predicted Zn-dependent peptidase